MSLQAKIAPSLLSGDFANLASECQRMIDFGADYLHMDVMDGHFVPNLTMGAPVIKSVRKHLPQAFLDCHLMVSDPLKWVDDFGKAGASQFTFHIEATNDAVSLIHTIRSKHPKMRIGVAVKPGTAIDTVFHLCDKIDMVLVMTVEPGFGGQSFMSDCIKKVEIIRQKYPLLDIQVDGGLSMENIDVAALGGANVIVAGTSIFAAKSPKEMIQSLRERLKAHGFQ